jgi:hypothetical protein
MLVRTITQEDESFPRQFARPEEDLIYTPQRARGGYVGCLMFVELCYI